MSWPLFILAAALALAMPLPAPAADDRPASTEPFSGDDVDRTRLTLDAPAAQGRFYGGLEYLVWWVKPAPLSVPLVTTGPIATTHHGWLDSSETTILYGAPYSPGQGGNNSQDFPLFSGARLTMGYWLDDERRFGIEASGFGLPKQSAGYEIRSDSSGYPVINIPVYNTISYSPMGRSAPPPGEDGLPASLPDDPKRYDGNKGVTVGGVKISNDLEFWGAELTGVFPLYQGKSWEISGLAGFRYLDLSEKFNLIYDSVGVSGQYSGAWGVAWDNFDTRNQFYGGNFGLRARYADGPLSVEISPRVAAGLNQEEQNVSGGFEANGFGIGGNSGSEGVFAQPANEGRTSSDRFALVPELQFKIGYAVTPWLRATFGYDFLYISNVIRPGDQITRDIPKGQTFKQGNAADSTASPVRLFSTTDFYAHGLTFGLEFTF